MRARADKSRPGCRVRDGRRQRDGARLPVPVGQPATGCGAIGVGAGQGEKYSRLVYGLAEAGEIAVAGDQVKKIAMLAGRGIGPFAGRARTVMGPCNRT